MSPLLRAQTAMDSLVAKAAALPSDTAKAMAFIDLSNRFRTAKVDYANARKYAQEALALSGRTGFRKGQFRGTIALAYATRDMGKHHEGIDLLKKAIVLYEGTPLLQQDPGLHITHVYTYTALADLYTYLPDYAAAQQAAFRALALSEQYGTGAGQCWITLSIIFSKQKNLSEARKYAVKAEEFFRQRNAWDDLARTYAFLARYAMTDKDYPDAIRYYSLSYETYRKANSAIGMQIALYNLAEIYLKTKELDKAARYIDETVAVNRASGTDPVYQFYINQLKFDISLAKKDYPTAGQTGNLLLGLAVEERNKEKISAAYRNLYALYLEKRDTANAFVVGEKISALKDSLYNADIAKSTADLARKYETEKKEQQIAFLDRENRLGREKLEKESLLADALKNENLLKESRLEKETLLGDALERENRLREQDIARQRSINSSLGRENRLMQANSRNEERVRWLLTGVLVLAAGLLFTLYRSYTRQRRANRQISRQADALQTLMSELHHRVKNNLQLVVSMISMQARGVHNGEALAILVNSENRLRTIAMVHEKLYRNGHLDSIVLENYLRELMDMLALQYRSAATDYQYTVADHAQLSIHPDIAIPLGLIVNELVTNAFKHAFDGPGPHILAVAIEVADGHMYTLTVTDNGRGLPGHRLPGNPSTLGLKLVSLLAGQLDGRLDYAYRGGSRFTVGFKA